MQKRISDQQLISEHLSNERTFLSWIRTGIGIMAFGFVAVKFSRIARRTAGAAGESKIMTSTWPEILGIALTACGALMILISYFRYRRSVELMRKGEYAYSTFYLTIMTTVLFAASVILVACLLLAPSFPESQDARPHEEIETPLL